MVATNLYAAIRMVNKGTIYQREWIDESSMSYDENECRQNANQMDGRIPIWAKDNPVVRIAKVKVEEILVGD